MFNRAQFEAGFEIAIVALQNAEKITKDTLRDLSRSLLIATHNTQDIAFINRTIDVLTPRNRQIAVLFFKDFSGFKYSDDEMKFVAKDKKNWEKIVLLVGKKLEDPHFNLWTWAEANVEDAAKKKFALADVTKFAQQAIKKAEKEGINKADVFKAFMDGGFAAAELVGIMQAMADAGQGE